MTPRLLHTTSLAIVMVLISASAQAGTTGVKAGNALDRESERAVEIKDGTMDSRFSLLSYERRYVQFKADFREKTGFEYLLYYTTMGHYGTNGRANLNGQLHTINAWTPCHGSPNAGTAIFYFMNIAQFTSTSAVELSNSLGLTTGINDSGGDVDMFRFVGWHQPLANERIDLYLGQFLLRDLFDSGDYATDDTRNFVSEIMSGNPTSTLPGSGLGAAATFKLSDQWSAGGGFSDANARPRALLDFKTFSEGEYAYIAHLNFRPEIGGLGTGDYKVNFYSVDSTESGGHSRGVSVLMEQELGDRYLTTFRYSWGDQRRTATKQFVAAGLMRRGIFQFEDDLLGIGAGWGDPTDSRLRGEYVLEAFWRAQLTPSVQVTPDVQLWLNPSKSPSSDVEAVFTLRATIDF